MTTPEPAHPWRKWEGDSPGWHPGHRYNRRIVDEKLRLKMQEERDAGDSLATIAVRHGVSHTTVARWTDPRR